MAITINVDGFDVNNANPIDKRLIVDSVSGPFPSLITLDTAYNYTNMIVWVRDEKAFYYLIDSPPEGGADFLDWALWSGGGTPGSTGCGKSGYVPGASFSDTSGLGPPPVSATASVVFDTPYSSASYSVAVTSHAFDEVDYVYSVIDKTENGFTIRTPTEGPIGATAMWITNCFDGGVGGGPGGGSAIDLEEIAFGTGTGITSSNLFTYDVSKTNLIFGPNSITFSNTSTLGFNNTVIGGLNNTIFSDTLGFNQPSDNNLIIGGYSNYLRTSGGSIIGSKYSYSSHEYSSILGGNCQCIQGNGKYSSLIGGECNLLCTSERSAIIGGYKNSIIGTSSILVGVFAASSSVIIGGNLNTICTSCSSTILGGSGSIICSANCSIIGGGEGNYMRSVQQSAIISGFDNKACLTRGSGIFAGDENTIYGSFFGNDCCRSVIVGGSKNYSHSSQDSTILGGKSVSLTQSNFSSIVSGCTNKINSSYNSTILGGSLNSICNSSNNSSVIAGKNSSITNKSIQSVVVGGFDNDIINSDSSLISGRSNTIYNSAYSSIIGAFGSSIGTQSKGFLKEPDNPINRLNTIIGGESNKIIGSSSCNSSIIGGASSSISESQRSVIIGGFGLTLSSEDSVVYVPKLKILNASSDESSTKVLVWGTNNYVGYKDASGLGSGGGTPPLPVPKINLMQGTQSVQVYNSSFNTVSTVSPAIIHNYPVLINMDFTSDHFSDPNNRIFIEMVHYKRKSRSGSASLSTRRYKGSSYVVPAKNLAGVGQDEENLPWLQIPGTNGFWSRGGSQNFNSSVVPIGIDRPNHYEVTSYTMSSSAIWEYFTGRFEFSNVAYRNTTGATVSLTNTLIPSSGKDKTGTNRPTNRFAYSPYYRPYYCAFRYIQWIPTANGGKGQIVSGPLSKIIKVTGLNFPFQTDYQQSAVLGFPVCSINALWAATYNELKCSWISSLP